MSTIDFRTELYRLRLPIYKIASEIDVHPSRLSLYLNGKLPTPPDIAEKLREVIARHREVGVVE